MTPTTERRADVNAKKQDPEDLIAIFESMYHHGLKGEDFKAARAAWPKLNFEDEYDIAAFFQNLRVTSKDGMMECRIRKAAIRAIPLDKLPQHLRDQKASS